MHPTIVDYIAILERSPASLKAQLQGLPEFFTHQNEGKDSWSVFDVVGHLIHGEKTDWMLRCEMILKEEEEAFPPFDRFAQEQDSQGKSLSELLDTFEQLRAKNMAQLKALNLESDDLLNEGIHPAFGKVKMSQLLATWVAHDLNHMAQIQRIMAYQIKDRVGPWKAYLRIVNT